MRRPPSRRRRAEPLPTRRGPGPAARPAAPSRADTPEDMRSRLADEQAGCPQKSGVFAGPGPGGLRIRLAPAPLVIRRRARAIVGKPAPLEVAMLARTAF